MHRERYAKELNSSRVLQSLSHANLAVSWNKIINQSPPSGSIFTLRNFKNRDGRCKYNDALSWYHDTNYEPCILNCGYRTDELCRFLFFYVDDLPDNEWIQTDDFCAWKNHFQIIFCVNFSLLRNVIRRYIILINFLCESVDINRYRKPA